MMSARDEHKQRSRRSAELLRYVPLVRKIAGKLRKRLPANVEMDDLVQLGLIGLDDALRRFEQGPGSTFETYAARRIEGEMLDALRAEDALSRTVRSQLRKARAAVRRLEQAAPHRRRPARAAPAAAAAPASSTSRTRPARARRTSGTRCRPGG